MRLLRLWTAVQILRVSNALYRVALWLKQPAGASRAPMHPAEQILLGSIVGLAICALWVAITWRAMQ